jgi:hypothetical protein
MDKFVPLLLFQSTRSFTLVSAVLLHSLFIGFLGCKFTKICIVFEGCASCILNMTHEDSCMLGNFDRVALLPANALPLKHVVSKSS